MDKVCSLLGYKQSLLRYNLRLHEKATPEIKPYITQNINMLIYEIQNLNERLR
ncbi:MAG: hypothetical protein N3I35_12540 [Clostridia bacterium]|nr:hypothetical protein [Clostridia bacterium]